jgi:hypothetical protein
VKNIRCGDDKSGHGSDNHVWYFDVVGTGAGSNGYDVFLGGWNGKAHWNYFGQSVTVGPIKGSDKSVELIIAINGNANCHKKFTVEAPKSCASNGHGDDGGKDRDHDGYSKAPSHGCDLQYKIANAEVKGNSWYFDVTVRGTGSNGYDVFTNGWATKAGWQYFGGTAKLGPFNRNDKAEIIIARNGDANCNIRVVVTLQNGGGHWRAATTAANNLEAANGELRMTDDNAALKIGNTTSLKAEMYPNPANTFVNIDLSQITNQEATVQIINQLGQVEQSVQVKDAGKLQLDTQRLGEGTYIMRIIGNNATLVTQRLMVSHKNND